MKPEKLLQETEDNLILFYIYFFLILASLFSGLWEYSLIQEVLQYEGDFESKKSMLIIIQTVISILQGLTNLFIIFYFIRWFYHSHLSLQKNDQIYYLNHSSKSAIWSWFIPVLNLMLPYLVMRENYESWEEHSGIATRPKISPVVLWWLFFLLSVLAGFFDIRVFEGINSTNPEKYLANPWPFIVPGMVELIAVFATVKMLKRFRMFYQLVVGA